MKIALTSARGIIQYGQACLEQEARRRTKCSPCWSLDIQLLCPPDASAPVSQALASGLNPIPAVLAFSPCRWQVMALLSHCIYGSQLLLHVVSNVHTHTDWFCFSREPWLVSHVKKKRILESLMLAMKYSNLMRLPCLLLIPHCPELVSWMCHRPEPGPRKLGITKAQHWCCQISFPGAPVPAWKVYCPGFFPG